jgi:hypothetical protein
MPTAINLSWINNSKNHTGQTIERVSAEDGSVLTSIDIAADVRTYTDTIPDAYDYGVVQYRIISTFQGDVDYSATSPNDVAIQYISTTFTAGAASAAVAIGATVPVEITVKPTVIAKGVTYTSNKPAIATVVATETGIEITGVSDGVATIAVEDNLGALLGTVVARVGNQITCIGASMMALFTADSPYTDVAFEYNGVVVDLGGSDLLTFINNNTATYGLMAQDTGTFWAIINTSSTDNMRIKITANDTTAKYTEHAYTGMPANKTILAEDNSVSFCITGIKGDIRPSLIIADKYITGTPTLITEPAADSTLRDFTGALPLGDVRLSGIYEDSVMGDSTGALLAISSVAESGKVSFYRNDDFLTPIAIPTNLVSEETTSNNWEYYPLTSDTFIAAALVSAKFTLHHVTINEDNTYALGGNYVSDIAVTSKVHVSPDGRYVAVANTTAKTATILLVTGTTLSVVGSLSYADAVTDATGVVYGYDGWYDATTYVVAIRTNTTAQTVYVGVYDVTDTTVIKAVESATLFSNVPTVGHGYITDSAGGFTHYDKANKAFSGTINIGDKLESGGFDPAGRFVPYANGTKLLVLSALDYSLSAYTIGTEVTDDLVPIV